jgi:hypothetical protein
MKQIEWRVRLACAERGIWSATELQRLVFRRTAVQLNVQTLQAWFRQRPVRIEVRTLNAVLNALGCDLKDLIQFEPPQSEKEARANVKEAAHFRQKDPELSAKAGKAKKGRKHPSRPDVSRMLDALTEGAAPLGNSRLRRGSTELSSSAKSNKKSAKN